MVLSTCLLFSQDLLRANTNTLNWKSLAISNCQSIIALQNNADPTTEYIRQMVTKIECLDSQQSIFQPEIRPEYAHFSCILFRNRAVIV